MSLRPLKHLGTGALKELLLSEEDYLAYRAGVHLGRITSDDLSALSLNDQATLVGRYEDTYTTEGTDTPTGAVVSRTFEVLLSSNPAGSTHSVTFDDIFSAIPSVVYVGDTLSITIIGNATSTGTGLDEIEYQIGASGNAGFNLARITADPAETHIDNYQVTWEDYNGSSLSGLYIANYIIRITDTGILNLVLNATSTDLNNSTSSATDSIVFNSIRVEPNERPNTDTDVYELYQNDNSVASISTDTTFKRNPFYWDRSASPAGLKEMTNAELDVVCERLVSKIFTNEYPGSFRLSADSPGQEWSEFLPDVFTDTRGDGSSITYSIWVKQYGTAPTRVNPVYPFRQNGVFAGIRELSDAEVEFTFGERMKKIIQETGIGEYRLRSATQGPPTEAGVWESRGSAVDTMRAFKEAESYIGTTPFEIQYLTDYVATYSGDYEVEYTPDYIGGYEGDYVSDYITEYVGAYEGDYIGTYQGDYTQDALVDYISEYIQNYLGNFEVPYVGDFLRNYIENVYEGDTLIEYLGDYLVTFEGEYVAETEVTYLGNFTSNYQTVETVSYTAEYLGNYLEDYDSGIEITYTGNFTENYTGDDQTTSTETYTSEFQQTYVSESYEIYVGDYIGPSYDVAGKQTITTTTYSSAYLGDYVGDYITAYEGDYIKTQDVTYTSDINYNSGSESYSVVSGASVFFDQAGEGDLQVYNYSFSGTLASEPDGQVASGIPSFEDPIGSSGYYRGDEISAGEYEVLTLSSGDTYTGNLDYIGDTDNFQESYIRDRVVTTSNTVTSPFVTGSVTVTYSRIINIHIYQYSVSATATPGGFFTRSAVRNITTTGSPPIAPSVTFSPYSGTTLKVNPTAISGTFPLSASRTSTTTTSTTTYTGPTYIGDFSETYIGAYLTAYESDYLGDYTSGYTHSAVTEEYIRFSYIPNYLVDYGGDFEAQYTGDFTQDYETDITTIYSSTDYLGDYLSDYVGDIAGAVYTGDYLSLYIDDTYEGDTILTYEGDYISSYTGDFSITYTQEPYIGNYISSYEGNFLVPYIQNYIGNFIETYIDESASIDYIAETYEAEYQANFETQTYTGNYFGVYAGAEDFETYEAEYVGDTYDTTYEGAYEGAPYLKEYVVDYDAGSYTTNYSNEYTVNEVEVSYTDDEVITSKPIVLETYTLYVRVANEVTLFAPLGADALITLDGLTLVVR